MGLQSDTLAATAAADELAAGARQQLASVEDLERVMAVGSTQLTDLVTAGTHSLAELQKLLGQMDSSLNTAFSAWGQTSDELHGRVGTLRQNVLAEFAANEKAMNELLPEVQDALRLVETAVREAEGRLQALRAEDERLVSVSEQQAAEAESQARAMLGVVQAQRQDLESQSKALDQSWSVLDKQLDSDLQALQAAFAQANSAAQATLDGVLEGLAAGAATTSKGVHATLVEATAEEMSKLAADLGRAVVELQTLGQVPRRLAEQELVALSKKLTNTTEPLGAMDRLYNKAKSLELFEL